MVEVELLFAKTVKQTTSMPASGEAVKSSHYPCQYVPSLICLLRSLALPKKVIFTLHFSFHLSFLTSNDTPPHNRQIF